ncbi:uncharacterized protein Dwil_GK16170 [Drosophila willistoni]|uniref:Uncharacterized protein n=1 Tax=Drosophila willistoni TaxID=7260 RepID=B4N271_DROWI|nr:caspase-8 [Drosophila willistoni]EDW78460.1 uncharacterized protein Dwil_GK16170 [Drosophila willistoni]
MTFPLKNFLIHMRSIDVLDLPYLERDLNFNQKVSLAFLLFGDQFSNGAYILQKLLALARHHEIERRQHDSDILSQYAKTNPEFWREHLIESLCIIQARRVLRKLGFNWAELRAHYLPQIIEITLHIHPLLKALYVICEQLTEHQSGRLVLDITDMLARRLGPNNMGDPFRFYDFKYLEIFLLDWICRRFLQLGDINAKGSNVEILIEYFKSKDMSVQAKLLIDTINANAGNTPEDSKPSAPPPPPVVKCEKDTAEDNKERQDIPKTQLPTSDLTPALHLTSRNAGIALIINQQSFHQNVDESLKHLLPFKTLRSRMGTDVDKQKLDNVFSSLGYQVEAHDNKDHLEMISLIRHACERSMLPDSLIVCILSHGFEGAVYATNSIPLKIIDIENIICANDNLKDKPKFLIIQACQQKDTMNNGKMFEMETRINLPNQHINMLLAMSTVPGFSAQRHTVQGSWFIQCLCEAIEQHGDSKHVGDILTIMINKVSQKCGNKGETMVPKISGSLKESVFLPRRQIK